LRRVFKTQAEKAAAAARLALKAGKLAPLDPWAYAGHLDVAILEFASLGLSAKSVRQLTVAEGESWSAMTLQEGDVFAIVLNPANALTRQRNDLMHEHGNCLAGEPHGPCRCGRM
jgi:hypothetical protein